MMHFYNLILTKLAQAVDAMMVRLSTNCGMAKEGFILMLEIYIWPSFPLMVFSNRNGKHIIFPLLFPLGSLGELRKSFVPGNTCLKLVFQWRFLTLKLVINFDYQN